MTPKLSGHFSTFRFAFLCAQVYSGNCQTMEYIERGLFATTIFGESTALQHSVAILFRLVQHCFNIYVTYEPVNLAIRGSKNGHDNKRILDKKKIWKSRLDVQNTIFELIFIQIVSFTIRNWLLLCFWAHFWTIESMHTVTGGQWSWFHIPRGWASGVNHSRG